MNSHTTLSQVAPFVLLHVEDVARSAAFYGQMLGATPPTPEWGSMISDGAAQFYSWWVALGPGLAILTIVLGFNFIGDGLHDYFDPKSR